jgi:hypothetical protein
MDGRGIDMIKVVGYSTKGRKLVELREATICCEYNDIDKIISFLKFVKDSHATDDWYDDYCHTHFRDWDDNWTGSETDIIIVSSKPGSETNKPL